MDYRHAQPGPSILAMPRGGVAPVPAFLPATQGRSFADGKALDASLIATFQNLQTRAREAARAGFAACNLAVLC